MPLTSSFVTFSNESIPKNGLSSLLVSQSAQAAASQACVRFFAVVSCASEADLPELELCLVMSVTLAILPKRHHVSELIMRYYHERTAHAGREQTLAESRRQFWIVNGRALAKDIVRHCTSCRRINATPLSQQMAPLPGSKGHSLSAAVQPNRCRLFRTALRETRSWNS